MSAGRRKEVQQYASESANGMTRQAPIIRSPAPMQAEVVIGNEV